MAPMSVIIVGGGPSGLLLARLLAQSGLRNIRLLERDPGPTHDYRAFLYQPIAFHEFQRAGIWDEVQAKATPLRSVCWRDAADAGKRLFGMPSKDTLLMSLNTLTGIIRTQLEQSNQGQILYGHEVTDVGQDGDIAWVDVQTPQGRRRMDASYVIGCDGGQSTVRKLAFGPGAMKGFTWDKQLVTADIQGHMSSRFADIEDSNIFIHPTNAWILFRLPERDDMWRVIYQDTAANDEQLVANAREKINLLLASESEPPPFELLAARPYHIHQRIVDDMVNGRVILAADAAHLCCPYGAMGLNGGIADVGSLSDCLSAIHQGKADISILHEYSRVRRQKWQAHIDPTSQRAIKFVYSDPADIIPDHPLYKMCKLLETNPDAMKTSAGLDPLILKHDFSQHFGQQTH